MAHINLLPWRAARRAKIQKRFFATMAASALTTALVLVAVWYGYVNAIGQQEDRNQRLKEEIKLLDKQIKEIRDLEKLKAQLLARMEVVERLQASRSGAVHFFNELARTLPEGVYLSSVSVVKNRLTISGEAQSNARVSAYMRALDSSPWFTQPDLVVIKTQSLGKGSNAVRSSSFTLTVKQLVKPEPVEGEVAPEGEEDV